MPDREKVIKGLESLRDICNAKSNMAIGKGKVAWAGYANASDDAIKRLKEQETEWEHLWDAPDGTFKGRCKNVDSFISSLKGMIHSINSAQSAEGR